MPTPSAVTQPPLVFAHEYPSTFSVPLRLRRCRCQVLIDAGYEVMTVYAVGCAEARGAELAADAMGYPSRLVVLEPAA